MFSFRESLDLDPVPAHGGRRRVEVAFTDATLDLQEDHPPFAASLASLVATTGVPFARLDQVHGADVHDVVEVPVSGPTGPVPVADALVTTCPGTGLMIRVADCVPVLLADPEAGVIGAAHAGRLGVVLGVVSRTVERMRALGADRITARIGPHICGRCYEVPAAMREDVSAVVPATYARTSWGTPALDLGAGVAAQLDAAGVAHVGVGGCTREDRALHSYRRDGSASGRLAGLVWLT